MIGQTISHYRILELIGEGGMGVVYRAVDERLNRDVAIKILAPHLHEDDTARKRFMHEARAASAFDHPNIATVFEVDETPDGMVFIVMALYSGETLRVRIARGPLPLDEALNLTRQIAAGLSQMHAKGIVHRDIKPGNIFITDDGTAKVIDFGLAQLRDVTRVTKSGATVGTLGYMSPEQVRGEDTDARSDVFSLGAMLYEMLTGLAPFRGQHEAAVLYAVMNKDPVAPRSLRPEIPEHVEQMIVRCLDKDRAKRVASTDELAAGLRGMHSKRSIHGVPRLPRWLSVVAAVAIGCVIAAVALPRWFPHGHSSANPKSIAVLPFVNLSGDPANEYFSDGITDDILAQLSKIADLTVISRTSVMKYKHTRKSIREIGKELGVATVLEGSVRRSNGRVRIVGQLIDTGTDKHRWAETYDRELADVFAIQSDVAERIAAALKLQFSDAERERIAKRPTGDLAAYDYYLKGQDYLLRYTKEDNERAIQLYQQALALDPRFARAWVGIANAYVGRVNQFGYASEWIDSAITTAKKALSIDPDIGPAYLALGNAHLLEGKYDVALDDYRRTLQVNPNNADAVGNIGLTYQFLGDRVESLRWYRQCVALDPTNAITPANIALLCTDIGDFAQAETSYRRALGLMPDLSYADFNLGLVYLLQGRGQEAMEHLKKTLSRYPDNVHGLLVAGRVALTLGRDEDAKTYFEELRRVVEPGSSEDRYASIRLAYLWWKRGEKDAAQKRLDVALASHKESVANGSDDFDDFIEIAAIQAIRGETRDACEWLQKAIDGGYMSRPWPSSNPLFENLYNEPCFQAAMAHLQTRAAS